MVHNSRHNAILNQALRKIICKISLDPESFSRTTKMSVDLEIASQKYLQRNLHLKEFFIDLVGRFIMECNDHGRNFPNTIFGNVVYTLQTHTIMQ